MNKNSGEQKKKESIIRVRLGPQYHRLSSLGKPRDAKRRSSGRNLIFYPTLTLLIDSYKTVSSRHARQAKLRPPVFGLLA